jgi:hypothetical protein
LSLRPWRRVTGPVQAGSSPSDEGNC